MPDAAIEARLREMPDYGPLFAQAFGDNRVSLDRVTKAIAAFERTLVTPDTPYDRFVRGDAGALSAPQKRGMALFQEIGCIECHSGPNFSEASSFSQASGFRLFPAIDNAWLDSFDLRADKGAASGARGLFRVPSLRNVALTGPYFHNGTVADLAEAVRIMAVSQRGVILSEDMREGQGIRWQPDQGRLGVSAAKVLTERDIEDMVAFLNALTSDRLAQDRAAPP